MKFVGAHVAVNNGVSSAPINAHNIGAKAFALFTRNPSRWQSKPISSKEAQAFKENCEEFGYTPDHILPHDSYLINLGSPEEEGLEKSRSAFLDEMERCQQLGLTMLNFHPGSHLRKMEIESCLDRIADSINVTLDKTEGVKAVIDPRDSFGKDIASYPTDLKYYQFLKNKWKVSIQAMIYRTHQLGIMSDNQYQYLMRQVSKNGWRLKEPGDSPYSLNENIFQGAIDLLIEQNVLTAKEILELFKKNGVTLYSEDIEELLHLRPDTLKVEEKVVPILQLRKK